MKEVKTPKKPLAYYYGIVLIVLIVFNLVVTPILMEHQVKETDYGTFMSMIEKKNIGEVEVEDNQIIFTDKDQKNIYKTGLMNDPNLTDRLYECGAVFAKDIDKQMSPIISFLLTGVLPLILFIALGNYMAVSYTHLEYRLDEQIRQAVLSLETKWTEKEIGFQVELEEVKYTGNEGLFMHIWINLLDNAIKFSPSKGTITMFYISNRKGRRA